MQATEQNADVLVIGDGMAGLTAAAELQRAGRRVLVLDKGQCEGEPSLDRCDFNPAVNFQMLLCVRGGCEEFFKRGI